MADPLEGFTTAQEVALYTTLRQVVQNHITTHHLGDATVLAACQVMASAVCAQLIPPERLAVALEMTVTTLQQFVRTRAVPFAPLPPVVTAGEDTPGGETLALALLALLGSTAQEQQLRGGALWRVVCALLGDALCLPQYTRGGTLADVDQAIADFMTQVRGDQPDWQAAGLSWPARDYPYRCPACGVPQEASGVCQWCADVPPEDPL